MKKLMLTVVSFIVVMISITSASAFALKDSIIYDESTSTTEQILVRMTRPEKDEATFKKSYIVSGNTNEENVIVKLLIFNEETKKYELFRNTEGESSWKIGALGFFVKEVEFPKNGINKMRIIAYSLDDEEHLILGENLQVNNFNITLLDRGIREAIRTGFTRFSDVFTQLFR